MRRLKLLIADDHGLIIEAVKHALENEPDFEIVAEAESGSQVLPLVQQTEPDLVILDLLMPGVDGLTCIGDIQERFPQIKIAVLSGVDTPDTAEAALNAGASAFISKRIDPEELPEALRAAAEGKVTEPFGRADRRAERRPETGLTERELAVLHLLGEGLSNKQIARSLWLSEQTVKFHLTNIYRRLGVSSRTAAVHRSYRYGLLEAPILRSTSKSA
jgi:NarL family two-component system response regulator LiaR